MTTQENEAFEKEFDVVAKQKQCACTQTARVNPSNREQALVNAGDKMAELLRGYATSQHELDAIHDWAKAKWER